MKFVILFLVCFVALAVADEEPTAEILNDLKGYFEGAVKELQATCENHKTACTDYLPKKFKGPGEKVKLLTEACTVLMGQYLCEGKKEGEALVDLYKQSKKFVDQI